MQVEADLIRNQPLQLRDEFLSRVARAAIAAHLDLLLHHHRCGWVGGETNPEQDEYLRIVLRNARQLEAMIEDLLEVTRAQAGKLSVELHPFRRPCHRVCGRNTQRICHRERDWRFLSSPRGLPQAYADESRVRQILTILLDNAVKFTLAGGVVSVQARVYEKDQGFLLVEVSDTGCGICPRRPRASLNTSTRSRIKRSTQPSCRPVRRAGAWGWACTLAENW